VAFLVFGNAVYAAVPEIGRFAFTEMLLLADCLNIGQDSGNMEKDQTE